MGGCWSKRNGCVTVGLTAGKVRRRRRRARVLSKSDSRHSEIQETHSNPTFQEHAAESWFDPSMAIDSEGDDDFYSVQDDVLSQRGHETESISSPRFAISVYLPSSNPSSVTVDHQKPANAVIISEISTQWVEEHEEDEEEGRSRGEVEARSLHNNCGLIPSTCLPSCLGPILPFDEKRGSKTPTSPATRKKASSLKFPFKWNQDQQNSPSLVSSPKPTFLQKPIAGSQVPFCPLDKIMSDCWSPIQPATFKVRGPNYLRDKKKEFAPNYAAFYPFGVDVFLSQRKIDHIARFVELPATSSSNSSGKIPPILVVNLQIPHYPATIFQNEYDGQGMSYVFYFKLNENYTQELPFNFQENLRKLIDDEVERVRGFPVDTIAPFRERLKILGRVVNMEDLHLSAAERKLMNAYNEKPVLSRPQHEFYLGENYLEIDLDMHRFSFIPRKGLEAFQERLKLCVMDFGLTIQGNKPEDLPEHLLCCLRLKEIDYHNYQQLSMF